MKTILLTHRTFLVLFATLQETHVTRYILKKLNEILAEPISWSKKNEIWNKVIEKIYDKLPPNYTLPIIVQTTDHPYKEETPKGLREKAHVSPTVLENDYEARKAIAGICTAMGPRYIKNANILSEGAISLATNINNEEVD